MVTVEVWVCIVVMSYCLGLSWVGHWVWYFVFVVSRVAFGDWWIDTW